MYNTLSLPINAGQPAEAGSVPTPVPVSGWAPWMLFAGLLMLVGIYFVGAEQGAWSLIGGSYVHELVHDARHLLAFPCH